MSNAFTGGGSAGSMFRAVNVRQTHPKADTPSERDSRIPAFLRDVIRRDAPPLPPVATEPEP